MEENKYIKNEIRDLRKNKSFLQKRHDITNIDLPLNKTMETNKEVTGPSSDFYTPNRAREISGKIDKNKHLNIHTQIPLFSNQLKAFHLFN